MQKRNAGISKAYKINTCPRCLKIFLWCMTLASFAKKNRLSAIIVAQSIFLFNTAKIFYAILICRSRTEHFPIRGAKCNRAT